MNFSWLHNLLHKSKKSTGVSCIRILAQIYKIIERMNAYLRMWLQSKLSFISLCPCLLLHTPHMWLFSQLHFTAYKNTCFILPLEEESIPILLDVFIETKPKGAILPCLTQLKWYLRMRFVIAGQITKLLTGLNLIAGAEWPVHMNQVFLGM